MVNQNFIKYLWGVLDDIPIDEDECIEVDFHICEAGTHREDIWHWFDDNSKNGVHELLYPNSHES